MPRLLAHGAFADVIDMDDGSVIKAFRRVKQTHAEVVNWDDHEFMVRQLWASEIRTYQRLQAHADLLPFTPAFHGVVDPTTLSLPHSQQTEPHVPSCGIRLELIPGRDIKVAHLSPDVKPQVEAILERIREIGGRINVWDASCFVPGPRSPFVLIDFALWDDLAEVQCYLDEHGQLPENVRRSATVRGV